MGVGAGVGVGLSEGDGEGGGGGLPSGRGDVEAEGEGEGDASTIGPEGGVPWPKGSQLSPEPAKGSQVGEEPLNQTSEPGPRPRTKTARVRATTSATTEEAIVRRKAGRPVQVDPYDALTALTSLFLFLLDLAGWADAIQNEGCPPFLQARREMTFPRHTRQT